ncbi:sensor domain-containing diguanylate cyclase [Paenibacillus sp. TRM 82003]|nr:sensor domain-containing diguanylate cyclase [Paenibacillus sp. TRM 82003]
MISTLRLLPPYIQGFVVSIAVAPFVLDFLLRDRSLDAVWFLHVGAVFLLSYYAGMRVGLIFTAAAVALHFFWEYFHVAGQTASIIDLASFGFNALILFLFAGSIGLLTDKLKEKHRELEDIFNSLDATIWSHDIKSDTIIISAGVELIYGYTDKQFREDPSLWNKVVHPEDIEIAQEMNRNALAGLPTNTEIRILRPDGEMRWIHDKASPIFDEDGKLVRINGMVMDITDRKLAEGKIKKLAYYDFLTDLPNRKYIDERLRASLEAPDGPIAVLFFDLDGFKQVNDTLGHESGDVLLQEVSRRLKSQLRPVDRLGRLGGDEFLAVIEGLDAEAIAEAAQRLIDAVSLPYDLSGRTAQVTLSIGISLYPKDGSTSEMLTKRADVAMYEAKALGKSRYRFYE